MRNVLIQAGINTEIADMTKDVVDTCRICRAWRKPSSKAMSHVTQSQGFNERIQIDLLFVESHIILHACDECTRFSLAEVILSKEPSENLRRFEAYVVEDLWSTKTNR
jgi:hypothetical protein